MLGAIDELPEDEREVFDLVRIQGMTRAEAARLELGACQQDVGSPDVRVPARSRLEEPSRGQRFAGKTTTRRD
jgi:hypothetical protein